MDSRPVTWYGVKFFRGNNGAGVAVSGTGNHKGCPYDGLAEGCCQRGGLAKAFESGNDGGRGERRVRELCRETAKKLDFV